MHDCVVIKLISIKLTNKILYGNGLNNIVVYFWKNKYSIKNLL